MVAFSAGMLVFFVLAAVLTRVLGERRAAGRFMLVMAGFFAVVLLATVWGGRTG